MIKKTCKGITFYVNNNSTQAKFQCWKDVRIYVEFNFENGLEGYDDVLEKHNTWDQGARIYNFQLESLHNCVHISKRLYYNSRKRARDKTTIRFIIRDESPIIMLCDKCIIVTGHLTRDKVGGK